MNNQYGPSQPNDPAYRIVALAASDTVNLDGTNPCRGLLVGTAGAATVVDAMGNVATLIPLQPGYNPIRLLRVYSTGLTASNIFVLY